ncbi:MAG: hypothetical protein JO062_25645 [Bryobacterales bacterium]|nr:hypothetical protein [Bryobacterales bacterium]
MRNLSRLIARCARAALEGRTVGELISEAIRVYPGRSTQKRRTTSLRALSPEPYRKGNERLSIEIDAIVYGARR